jgi:hypothetical protein
MKSNVALYDTLMKLRTAAAAVYDLNAGMKQEELQALMEPISRALTQTILHAVRHDLGGVTMTVQMFEHQKEAYREDVKFLLQKIADVDHHERSLRAAMVGHMKAEGAKELHDNGFMATLSGAPGKETVTFR